MTDRLQYLVQLLDDDDDIVQQCVDRAIIDMGPDVLHALSALEKREKDATLKTAIKWKMEMYNAEFRIRELRKAATQSSRISLFETGFTVSKLIDPKLSRMEFDQLFYQCACDFMNEYSDARTAVENARIFSHIFYHRLLFRPCDTLLSSERHASIVNVMKERTGNPIALSYVYFMIAQESALPIQPLCFPGGFVPAYVENGRPIFYINIFRNGEIFLEDKLKEFLTVQGMQFDASQFQLKDESTVLTIYLESLQYLYSSIGRQTKCDNIEKVLEAFGNERFLTRDEEQE
jgi:hypothetical protein